VAEDARIKGKSLRPLPVAADGWRFIIPLVIAGGILVARGGEWLSFSAGVLLLLAAAFCLFFFRDFERNTPADDNVLYSPGDGKVVDVSQVHDANEGSYRLIRIFLSVLDGHVQRSPVEGRVKTVIYKKGTFLDARHERAHLENESNALAIESKHGTVIVTQIAGLIARRIVCWAKPGHKLKQGQRFGLIRFGSQVDLALPLSAKVTVAAGDRVVSGQTVVATWA
jgi:phosphatidylserine decarboxylase